MFEYLSTSEQVDAVRKAQRQKPSGGIDPTKIEAYSKLYALEVDATEAAESFLARVVEASEAPSEETGLSSSLRIDTVQQMLSSVPGVDGSRFDLTGFEACKEYGI
ncbi:hypothetical protein FGB62_31g134 [Gracilaria domingensis]|nr:hypothetical protein FGB62_31g134 [Gracilaria domingensis]